MKISKIHNHLKESRHITSATATKPFGLNTNPEGLPGIRIDKNRKFAVTPKEQGVKDEEKPLSTKKVEISSKKSIEVDRNVDRVDNNQENIETSSSKKLKTNGNIIEGYNSIFGEDIVDNKGNVVGSKISDTRPNGKKYYQTLTDDTPENRKGFGWQEHQDIDGKIFKKFETLDDLEKIIYPI